MWPAPKISGQRLQATDHRCPYVSNQIFTLSINSNLLQKIDAASFNENLFQNKVVAEMLFGDSLDAFIAVSKEWDEFSKFIPKLEKFRQNYLEQTLTKTYTANSADAGYNVLNHGDFHLRNMLFKTNEARIEDFRFVSIKQNQYIK